MQAQTVENYPLMLKVEHVSEIVGCSKRVAYELMEHPNFPLVRMGRLKRVQREAFFQWLSSQANGSSNHSPHAVTIL
ncbi:Prophage LambdaBa04, DNA binding protein [Salimicrobium jeotgali]|uniref:Prophage LambdaBa04, DNA binding protein n=1 Tax=Salimicrobium jeotgali TaxID=1230341 RepID=K2H695_9BACI|nr:Prophage LambdaBa04, DNA binding protein [Salimicrobium jeotgali]MBM7696922.1 excisionase family DNA binding protein [Salimicrobium jeotgali]